MNIQEYERLNPQYVMQHQGRRLVYAVPNTACAWRVKTLFTKEASTIEWLDSLPMGTDFVDVGANIGMYSVYAGVMRECRVFAFEPESQNYAILQRNFVANELGGRAIGWCAALSDAEAVDRLYLSQFSPGGSGHFFGESRDTFLRERDSPVVQGSLAVTLDRLVQTAVVPVPQSVKIDVDGLEHRVIKGAEQTLRDPTVRSLLVEINPRLEEHRWIVDYLRGLGFAYDPEQVARAERKDGPFKGLAEYVFRR